MQDEGGGFGPVQPVSAPGADQHARRGRQTLYRNIAPTQYREVTDDLLEAVATVDCDHGPCRFECAGRHLEPACEVGARFDGGQSLAGIGRWIGHGGRQIRRISRDMVEKTQMARQRIGEVVHQRLHVLDCLVELGIPTGQRGQCRLQLDADNRATGHAGSQTKSHGSNARAEIENALARAGLDRCGQQNRIDGDPISPTRLQQAHPAAQESVFCRLHFHARDHLTTSCRNNQASLESYSLVMATVVSLEGKRKAPSLEPLLSLCADDMVQVDREILARMRSPVALIPELANHLVGAGGKRMRPLLTVAAARLCGYQEVSDRHIKLATCVEFIHSATLLHDDVVDVSALRRGKPSANTVWGDKASVLVGDFLFTRSFELMVDVGSLDILGVLSRASSTIAEGEVLQLVSQRDISTPESTYLEVIKAKTAKLFAAAAEVGAMVAGRNGPERVALESFGMNLGIAFQLVDDALDYSGREAKLGKSVGDDFREGKITLPVILAFLRGGAVDREFWKRTIEKLDQRDGDLEQAQTLIERHGALADTLERARHYGAMARDGLGLFPASPLKAALLEAVDFAIDRAH